MIIGYNKGLKKTMRQVELVAQTDSTALILGETGAGKEIIARHIHMNSARANNNFIRVNCGAIPTDLIDSELFGHEKGSFTGATSLKKGWFERAHGGTLFLDEVGELSLAAQVRLLRVLQEGTLCRVGGEKEISVDVRIVAATHRNLEESSRNGGFREDLWFRINVFPITLPSLRHRPEDIRELTEYFAQKASVKLGLPLTLPSQSQINYLMQYHWPGNVRELQVIVERAAILGQGTHLAIEESLIIKPELLSSVARSHLLDITHQESSPISLDDVIRQHITKTLIYCHGRIEGPFGAAKRLDINPNTLRSKIQKLGINKFNSA
ncbi:sigma-54 dependent transcriptional regulator [Paraglaciecola sp.]|uniref:sigma-54 interaction domain-containing protein n=1 Tax=Paraglaciecola sp. TaxID=1920173 RepID=UPI0030F48406